MRRRTKRKRRRMTKRKRMGRRPQWVSKFQAMRGELRDHPETPVPLHPAALLPWGSPPHAIRALGPPGRHHWALRTQSLEEEGGDLLALLLLMVMMMVADGAAPHRHSTVHLMDRAHPRWIHE